MGLFNIGSGGEAELNAVPPSPTNNMVAPIALSRIAKPSLGEYDVFIKG